VKGLSKRKPRPRWDTAQSTARAAEKVDFGEKSVSQLIEKNGGDDGTRTRALR